VTVGLLIDSAMFGADVAEVEIGPIKQERRPPEMSGDLAVQVLRTVLDRAACYGRLQPRAVQELEDIRRYTAAELPVALASAGRPKRLALLNMDGVLLKGLFVEHLAQVLDKEEQLASLLHDASLSNEEQIRSFARLFQGVPKSVFEQMAYEVPLTPGATELVTGLRKAAFHVGIITEGFHLAADIIRRRVSADFSVGHLLTFRHDAASGNLLLCPAMFHSQGCIRHTCCKQNILLHMLERLDISAERTLVVGNTLADTCLLQTAGIPIAFHPQHLEVRDAAQYVVTGSLRTILDVVQI
jgi:phosphoserine phosphatase